MGYAILLTAALAAFGPATTTAASRLFYNAGTLDGWDYIRKENKGTVDVVSNVVYKGTSAIKVTQTFDTNYHDRYHSEVDHNDGYRAGDVRTYGFMFRLSESWDFTSQSYNLAQFIANRPGSDNCGDDWMPSTMIWVAGNQLHTRIVNGKYRGSDCSRNIIPFTNRAQVSPGQWHKVIVQARWANDASGYLKLYFDGQQVLNQTGIATTVSGNDQFQFRVGLYANAWHDQNNHLEGSQGFRQVWYDEIAVGNTISDVDPDQN